MTLYEDWLEDITVHGGLQNLHLYLEIERIRTTGVSYLSGGIYVPDRDAEGYPANRPVRSYAHRSEFIRIATRRKLRPNMGRKAFNAAVLSYVHDLVTHEVRESLKAQGTRIREEHPPERGADTMRTQARPLDPNDPTIIPPWSKTRGGM